MTCIPVILTPDEVALLQEALARYREKRCDEDGLMQQVSDKLADAERRMRRNHENHYRRNG